MVLNEYKHRYEKKQDRIEVRLDESMLQQLVAIRAKTGISVSEQVRDAIRAALPKLNEKAL